MFSSHKVLQKTFTNLYLEGNSDDGYRMRVREEYREARMCTLNTVHLGAALIACLTRIRSAPRWSLPFPSPEPITRIYLVKKLLHEPLKFHFNFFNAAARKTLLDLLGDTQNASQLNNIQGNEIFANLLSDRISEAYHYNTYAVVKMTAVFCFTILNQVSDYVLANDHKVYYRRFKLRYRVH